MPRGVRVDDGEDRGRRGDADRERGDRRARQPRGPRTQVAARSGCPNHLVLPAMSPGDQSASQTAPVLSRGRPATMPGAGTGPTRGSSTSQDVELRLPLASQSRRRRLRDEADPGRAPATGPAPGRAPRRPDVFAGRKRRRPLPRSSSRYRAPPPRAPVPRWHDPRHTCAAAAARAAPRLVFPRGLHEPSGLEPPQGRTHGAARQPVARDTSKPWR